MSTAKITGVSYAATARTKEANSSNLKKKEDPGPWSLGTWLKVNVTEKGVAKQYVGQFYGFDSTSGLLALQAPTAAPENKAVLLLDGLGDSSLKSRSLNKKCDIFIFHMETIDNITNLYSTTEKSDDPSNSKYKTDRSALIPMGSVALNKLYAKEQEAIKREKEKLRL